MSSKRALVIRLAPPSAPCFPDRLSWVEFLVEAAHATKDGCRGPLDLRRAVPVFNLTFDMCADCTAKHALEMQRHGRCKPDHLRALIPAKQEKTGV